MSTLASRMCPDAITITRCERSACQRTERLLGMD